MELTIKDTILNDKQLKDLKSGDWFICGEVLFIKSNEDNGGSVSCMKLSNGSHNGCIVEFSENEWVEAINKVDINYE